MTRINQTVFQQRTNSPKGTVHKLNSGLSSLLAHPSQKGLLDSTLVVVSTEFGRKAEVNPNKARDHHPDGFTYLMAGAGLKAVQIYGSTTKDGKHADENVLDVTDFNASIAWRPGSDPGFEENSTSGRPFGLDNKGKARKELFGLVSSTDSGKPNP
ncbi:MAG: DUF1501 domain-containing protein [Verrucomicrobiales bacterium]